MPVFVPPDLFLYFVLLLLGWGWLRPSWGSILNLGQNCKWDLCVLSLDPTQCRHLSAVLILNLFFVLSVCV